MDKLFLRVYLNIFVSMALAAALFWIFVKPRIEDRLSRNIEEALSAPVAVMAEVAADQYAEHRDFGGPLEQASKRFRAPVALLSRDDLRLDAGMLARLDRGEVVRTAEVEHSTFFARIKGSREVLRVGPLNAVHPWGEGRGVSALLLVVGGLSIGVYLLVRPIRRRLSSLARTADTISRGDLGARADVGSRDAIGDLASAFNRMAGEIQRLFAAQEELSRMISHELRTPLQRLSFALEDVREAEDASARERGISRIERDIEEMDHLIEQLMTYVRLQEQGPPVRAPVELGPVIAELCEELSDMGGGKSLSRREAPEGPFTVGVEARLMRHAVSNLIVNALRYARSRVEVTVERDGQMIRINVDDDGPGVPAAEREWIFEPFHRLDDERTRSTRGFGLGLSIVRRIAEAHAGSVTALTSELGGARFRLSLPRWP